MKFLKIICVLAITLCLAGSVYAETQSVKVSGDLTMRGIYRDQYSLLTSVNENPQTNASAQGGPVTGVDGTNQSWAMTVAAVEVDADLTDNVTTVIRMLNQRDWNVNQNMNQTGGPNNLIPNGRGGYVPNTDEFNVMVDLAYVQLKNFIYSPLTLTIGRQDLWFGKGFIIGANQQNPGNPLAVAAPNIFGTTGAPNTIVPGNLSAPEYTAINSFDSIKAVLDYDPWTITGVYALIYEDSVQARDNVDLWGVNVGYKFNKMNGEAEGYWFYKADREVSMQTDLKSNSNDVHTVGLRGSFDPITWITLAGEAAVQGGEYVGNGWQNSSRSRLALGLDFSAECKYFTDKYSWKPKFGAEYIYYSGNKPEDSVTRASGVYNGWDPMYRGKYDSAIREFVGKFYATARYPVRQDNAQSVADDSRTNQNQIIFLGSLQPMDSLTLKANYNLFWNDKAYIDTPPLTGRFAQGYDKTKGFVGQELDLSANWDYTEDVSFNLLAGWFIPGEVYYDGKDATATDLVGSVKVSF
ncbi:MAG: alginate export family protein [Candidatus Omnitrophica bacterium]|nr:alginate export family protein [Candidatus Omnitrophota bacterium]MDD5436345.1 alginate export family protein [Candidatus Omnitrophota bacterium]